MAGHSKYANIKHRKGAQDAKRAKVFSKLGREITVAAKLGGPDPAMNRDDPFGSRGGPLTGNASSIGTPLSSKDFVGGDATVRRLLEELGFDVLVLGE